MSDDKPEIKNYGANSKKIREEADSDNRKVSAVVRNKVRERKPSLGKRFAASFAGDDAQTVGQYILFDVIIPATKNLITDMVSQGIERLMFGTSSPRRPSTVYRPGHTSYNRMYKGEDERRTISDRGRRTHDFREIVMDTREEASDVLDHLRDLIDRYGSASISDFYSLCDISSDHVDIKWGWTDLPNVEISMVRGGGYILELPPTEQLK